MLITDFDGTLVRLAVDWSALRERLGIARMGEIWTRDDPNVFEQVAAAEREGARRGTDVELMPLAQRCDAIYDRGKLAYWDELLPAGMSQESAEHGPP